MAWGGPVSRHLMRVRAAWEWMPQPGCVPLECGLVTARDVARCYVRQLEQAKKTIQLSQASKLGVLALQNKRPLSTELAWCSW